MKFLNATGMIPSQGFMNYIIHDKKFKLEKFLKVPAIKTLYLTSQAKVQSCNANIFIAWERMDNEIDLLPDPQPEKKH
ncbi:CLUMA_CG017797, isoform A [Clunio marinus]|uniref:CLUMA_CG017797, isoform A n=1 Tax=Clunio marinus TaxID=568069 RepID=A0A1J1J1J9_9DIPT|nr:CLUMA_CG017797, isoform A [Clunio marinus]